MLAVRSNERAAAAAGINVRNTKLAGFGIAAFIAGMAGALYAYNFGSVSSSRFGALAALGLIAFAYFGGITMVSGAIIAGIGATEGLFPHGFDKWFGLSGNWALLVGGFALIITLLVNPEGIAGTGYMKKQQKESEAARREAAERRRPTRSRAPPAAAQSCGRAQAENRAPSSSRRTRHVRLVRRPARRSTKSTSRSSEGQLVGLIGPNGAGKTTFIDAISGFVPYRGRSSSTGTRLDGLAAHARAQRGLARTWQSIELFDDLSVRENLAVASVPPLRPGRREGALSQAGASTKAADAALELLGLGALADAMPERPLAGPAQAGRDRSRARGRAAAALPRRAGGGPRHARGSRSWRATCARSSTPARRCSWSTTTWGSCSESPTTWSCSSSAR